MLFASHWVTGESGLTIGMMVLAFVPYLVLGIAGYLIIGYLRRDHDEAQGHHE